MVYKTKYRFPAGWSRFQAGWSRFQAGWSWFQAGWSWFQAGWSWFQAGWSRFHTRLSRFQAGQSRFPAGRKIVCLALSARLKPTGQEEDKDHIKIVCGGKKWRGIRRWGEKRAEKGRRSWKARSVKDCKELFFPRTWQWFWERVSYPPYSTNVLYFFVANGSMYSCAINAGESCVSVSVSNQPSASA